MQFLTVVKKKQVQIPIAYPSISKHPKWTNTMQGVHPPPPLLRYDMMLLVDLLLHEIVSVVFGMYFICAMYLP